MPGLNFILILVLLVGYIAYSILSRIYIRKKVLRGVSIKNGQVNGVDISHAENVELHFPLKKYSSMYGELLFLFLILSAYMIYHIIIYFFDRLALSDNADILLVKIENSSINSFCIFNILVLFLCLWLVFFTTLKQFTFTTIRVNRDGIYSNDSDASQFTILKWTTFIVINVVFIGLMGYLYYCINHILNIKNYVPILYIHFFLITDFIILYKLNKTKDIHLAGISLGIFQIVGTFLGFIPYIMYFRLCDVDKNSGNKRKKSLPKSLQWNEIKRIEYIVSLRYLIYAFILKDIDRIKKNKGNHFYSHFLRIVLPGHKDAHYYISLDSSFNLCQRLFFSKQHDNSIFIPLAILCKAHGIQFNLQLKEKEI